MEFCLCINPQCPEPKRPSDEEPCQACSSELLLWERYRVTDVLHQRPDGVTKVYDVIDTQDNNSQKVLKVLYSGRDEANRRFSQEANILINHPIDGLPQVEGDGEGFFPIIFPNNLKPAACLVMEKIEGMNLQQWLESHNNQPISESQAVDWLIQLTTILGKLHEQHFFPRDIKPSNIMWRERDGKLFLIDLGAIGAISQAFLEGQTTPIIGTPGYMAPEQQKGKFVPQSNFYALGCTFVHLLTGEHPDRLPEDKGKLIWQPSTAGLSGRFIKLIDSLIEINPEKRPQSTKDILQELIIIEARSQSPGKSIFTLRKIVGLIVLLALIGLGILAIKPPQNPISTPTRSLNFPKSSTDKCRIRKDRKPSYNALAEDGKAGIYQAIAKAELNPLKTNQILISQKDCTIIVEVILPEGLDLSAQVKEEITTLIKDNINPEVKDIVNIEIKPKYLLST
jgi:serine/threonine protein kinase